MNRIHYKVFNRAFCALLFSAVLFAVPPCWAERYVISEPIAVETRTVDPDRPGQEAGRTWEILPGKTPEGAFLLTFFRAPADRAFGRLVFKQADNTVVWEGTGGDMSALKKGRLLIIPGFPAPCDVLPVSGIFESEGSTTYTIRRKVGGRVFADRIRVTAEAFDAAAALKNGWITEGSETKGFRLITAQDAATGELMVRQLWPEAGDWWVYEEAPNRRSWLKK
jgi:hypothetical protein